MLISSRILHFSSSVRTLPRFTLLHRFDTFHWLKFIIQIMDCWMWWIFLHLRIKFSIKLYKIVNYKLVTALHTHKFFPPAATEFKGAMGEISNFYNFSPRLFISWRTHSSYNNYTCCKVSLVPLTYFLSYDFIFLEIRTCIQNLSPCDNL